jgi:integrase/recombinase XerD
MSVTIRKRKNRDGTTSIRLDIYANGKHTIETLKHLKLSKGNTIEERAEDKEKLQLAKAIRHERTLELEANNYNVETDSSKRTIVIEWMDNYIKKYTKSDIRNIEGARKRFKSFLEEKKMVHLKFANLTPLLIEEFVDYLEAKSVGEGAKSYFGRFKKMIFNAYKSKILKENILDFVDKRPKGKAKQKDTLTIKEIEECLKTPLANLEIRNAFLFACMTGLRFSDIKDLKWLNIDLKNKQLRKTQLKTSTEVTVNLNTSAIALIGERPDDLKKLVFKLPSSTAVNKAIKKWVVKAGIQKHITFHNARHSFGTNLAENNVDGLSISQIMGHANQAQVKRYIKMSKERKQSATDTINIDLSNFRNEK